MLHIWAVKIHEDTDISVFEKLWRCIPKESQQRISKFYQPVDRHRSLIGECMARCMIQSYYQIPASAILLERDPYGKPKLIHQPSIHFNISHAGSWVVCATSNLPVGIDVEKKKPIDLSAAKNIFAKEELDRLHACEPEYQTDYFYALWSLKESYIKAIGTGFSISTASFCVRIDKDRILLEYSPYDSACHFRQYPLEDGYVLALCCFEMAHCQKPFKLSPTDLVQRIYTNADKHG